MPSHLRAVEGCPPGISAAGCSLDEAVADPGLGEDVPRARRVGLELAPQLVAVDAQVVRLAAVARTHTALSRSAWVTTRPRCLASSPSSRHSVGREVHGVAVPGRGERAEVDRERVGDDGGMPPSTSPSPPPRRSAERTRAISSSIPNGLVT